MEWAPVWGSFDGEEPSSDSDSDEDPFATMHVEGGPSLAPFVATNVKWVRSLLELASVTPEDVVCDLGSGDGRVPIYAAHSGCRGGVCVDIDKALVDRAAGLAARRLGPAADKVRVVQADAATLAVDGDVLKDVTVLFLFLLPDGLPALTALVDAFLQRPGARVVCRTWELPGVVPAATEEFGETSVACQAYLYTSSAAAKK